MNTDTDRFDAALRRATACGVTCAELEQMADAARQFGRTTRDVDPADALDALVALRNIYRRPPRTQVGAVEGAVTGWAVVVAVGWAVWTARRWFR